MLRLRVVQGSLIVVQMEINSSGPFDFVVDTGSQVTIIDPLLASELHVVVQGTTGFGGVATYSRQGFAYLDLIEAGANVVPKLLAVIKEIGQLKAADVRIRGILGANFLEHFDLLIDNRQHILCLDGSGVLASEVNGERIALAEPLGSQEDLPFTRPIMVAAHLSASDKTQVLLRLDSGSNAALLYVANSHFGGAPFHPAPQLKRVVDGVEQRFAVLPPQDVRIGKRSVRQVSFVLPLNAIGVGPAPREDGLLPTMAFQRVFISYTGLYAKFDNWCY